MNNEAQIEQVELSIEHAKLSIDNKIALQRLTNNKDFEKIILEGYFKDEASRLVLLKADPSMDNFQALIDKQIIAVGQFRQYLATIMVLGTQAEKAIADDEETREELLAEGLE